ncbi:MAG TPA: hypothetical protein VLU96_08305 [Gaiellaceae bacterium]|nr:hypothetical protein [Gaiellaceae bacterium]
MKRLVLIALAAFAAFGFAPHRAAAADETCGIPNKGTLWIDFADGTVPFWQEFAQPGVIGAASNFIYPQLLRSYGAKTVYWDMHLIRRVGTPLEPFDPALVVDRANRMYNVAALSLGCAHPMIAENELNGASLITPWSATNAQYRRDVLLYLQTLAARGARPVLLVPTAPYMGDVAADWWKQVAAYADIVSESYFAAPRVAKEGPLAGSRTLRALFRNRVAPYTALGIPTRQLGIMLGFHTTPGSGGREHARLGAWLEVTKLQALAAKEVAKELGLRSVWSWGWGVFGKGSPEDDPQKPLAACVYLWTRNPKLCDGPKAAGPKFDTSRTQGQLVFPAGARCKVNGKLIEGSVIRGLTPVTGDTDVAFTAAYARVIASFYQKLKASQVVQAERAVVGSRFGSYGAYRAALARANATPAVARGVIADELRRAMIERHMPAAQPSSADVQSYYQMYADTEVRFVETKSPVAWLGNSTRGFALASNAPPQLFRLRSNGWATIRTMLGPIQVRALQPAVPLGGIPLMLARPAVVAALKALARDHAYERWLLARERGYNVITLCRRDVQPTPGVVPLTDYLPFLAAQ